MALQITGKIQEILDIAAKLQKYGTEKNIVSVFDDGGYRELLLATLFGLTLHVGRHGDDVVDVTNNYELKTVNLVDTSGKLRKNPGITTCHHVNHEIIRRYRNLHSWLIGIFFINEPVEIYEVPANALAPYLDKWESRLNKEQIGHINNPKISFADVRAKGIKHYENKDLVEKYILSNIPRGTLVFKDILEFDKTHIYIKDEKIEADTEGA